MTNFIGLLSILATCVCVFATPVKHSGMYGDKYQGDIKLTEAQERVLVHKIRGRTGWLDSFFRWHRNVQGYVIVPYVFSPAAGFTEGEINQMISEMRILESRTCIRFVARTIEIDFVEVVKAGGCWSWLGRIGGRQELSMDDGCVFPGIFAHELIHALGYDHMHNAIERDEYVRINWDNIDPDMRFNFEKVDPDWFGNFGTTYDLRSIMHYPRWAFSTNGLDTIETLNPTYQDIIGALDVSEGDFTRIIRMYQC